MNGNKVLPPVPYIGGKYVHFFHRNITDGQAAGGNAVTMNVYLPTRPQRITQYPVGGIGVIKTQRKVVITIGIEFIDLVKALWYLCRNYLLPLWQ